MDLAELVAKGKSIMWLERMGQVGRDAYWLVESCRIPDLLNVDRWRAALPGIATFDNLDSRYHLTELLLRCPIRCGIRAQTSGMSIGKSGAVHSK